MITWAFLIRERGSSEVNDNYVRPKVYINPAAIIGVESTGKGECRIYYGSGSAVVLADAEEVVQMLGKMSSKN